MAQAVDSSGGVKGDFHIHTNYSDGVFSPEKIVDLALEAGLQAISLTDHDNVLSYGVAKEYLQTDDDTSRDVKNACGYVVYELDHPKGLYGVDLFIIPLGRFGVK